MSLVKSLVLASAMASLAAAGCRSNDPTAPGPDRHGEPAPTPLPGAEAGATARGGTGGSAEDTTPPTADKAASRRVEQAERRYFDVERRRPAQAVCAAPLAFVAFDTARLAQQRALVAEVWRLYPEFVQVSGKAPAAPFEVRIFSASGSAHPGAIWIECSDSLTCARVGAVLASAAGRGFAHQCAAIPEIERGAEWGVVLPSGEAPRLPAACGRARLCTSLELGHSWACSLFVPDELTSCAAASSCSDVARCVEGLGLASAKPGAPAKPYPSLEPPWEMDTTSGRGY